MKEAKFLHTRIRVRDLHRSIDWYCNNCGFNLKSHHPNSPDGNELAMLGIPNSDHLLELCFSPDFKVEFPEDLVHTCIGVDDLRATCQELEDKGEVVWPEDWKTQFYEDDTWGMAFITDPDGYEVEILSNKRFEKE